jgi:hypothetical protein
MKSKKKSLTCQTHGPCQPAKHMNRSMKFIDFNKITFSKTIFLTTWKENRQ